MQLFINRPADKVGHKTKKIMSSKAKVTAPKKAVKKAVKPADNKVKGLTIKFVLDQKGIAVKNPDKESILLSPLEFTATVTDCTKVSLANVAGMTANKMYFLLRSIPSRKYGFNLSFFMDDKLTDNVSFQSKATIRYTNDREIAFGLLNILVAAFNRDNTGMITGQATQGSEVKQLLSVIGLKATNLPLFLSLEALNIKRKQNAQVAKGAKRSMSVDMYGELYVSNLEAKRAEISAAKKAAKEAAAKVTA